MRVKFIQINIYLGKYLDELVEFLKKEGPDIVSMQEVSTYNFNLCSDKTLNLFEYLKKELDMSGVFHSDVRLLGDEKSAFGNAVFSKWPIISSKVKILKPSKDVTTEEVHGYFPDLFELYPKHIIECEIDLGGRTVNAISWHGAWTAPPHDTLETIRQATIVKNYLKELKNPFILGGDLNNVMGTKTVDMLGEVASNLMIGKNISMTTNPRVHKIAPKGFPIDFVFTSRRIKPIRLEVPDITISDHLPIVAELEV